MCKEGVTVKEIAAELGLKYMQVWHIINNNGFTKANGRCWYNDKIVKEIEQYMENGLTYSEIGKIYNKEKFHISCIAKKYQLTSKIHAGMSEKSKELVIKLYKEGKNFKQIEKESGVPDSTFSVFLKSKGLLSDVAKVRSLNKNLSNEGMRKCGTCQQILNMEDFHNRICKDCSRHHGRKLYAKNRKSMTLEKISVLRIKNAKGRALRKSLDFNLTVDDFIKMYVEQKGLCFYSGEKLCLNLAEDESVSIDRTDSKKGYTKDNCVLTTYRVNVMKNSLESNHFISICKKIAKKNL